MNDGVWGNDAVPQGRRQGLIGLLLVLALMATAGWVVVCVANNFKAQSRAKWEKELEERRAARAARAAQAAEEAR